MACSLLNLAVPMTRGPRSRALVFISATPIALLVLAACGGRTATPGPFPDTHAEPQSVRDAGTDALRGLDGEPPPDTGSACPAASTVNSGLGCSIPNQTCPSSPVDFDCNGQPTVPLDCVCHDTWFCGHVLQTCPGAQPMCRPELIHPGEACDLPPSVSCTGAATFDGCQGPMAVPVAGACRCLQGQWNCPWLVPSASCPDASMPPATCPDPTTLLEGVPCSNSGLVCKGNPTECGGATFYDAFQCDGTKFFTAAATFCRIDARADASAQQD